MELKVNFDDGQPIFQQIAEMIEDDILNGTYEEDDQIISTTQFAKIFQINPATATKGINLLVQEEIVYKKRGLGMFVTPGAKQKILDKRKAAFQRDFIVKLLEDAAKIQLSVEDVIEMIRKSGGK